MKRSILIAIAALALHVTGCSASDGTSRAGGPSTHGASGAGGDIQKPTGGNGQGGGAGESTGGTVSSGGLGGAAGADGGAGGSAQSPLVPPAGISSGGPGAGEAQGATKQADGVTYRLIAPGTAGPHPLMIVYSGTEGGGAMTQNLMQVKGMSNAGDFVFAILDGVTYRGNGSAGATVLDAVRALYDIDNDRTYLLSESAGTTAGLQLGFELRQSYFAAFWANDVNARGVPGASAAELGFAPYGNAGPGGDWPDANAIVSAMQEAGYRTPAPAPYDGQGSDTHGDPNQFVAAVRWFAGKTRQ